MVGGYAAPTVPFGTLLVVIASGGITASVTPLVANAPSVSVARTSSVNVPAPVGVPETTPPDESDRPAGIAPELSVHVSVPMAFVAASAGPV